MANGNSERQAPSLRVGGYSAPVDTTGMSQSDPEVLKTMTQQPSNPFMTAFKNLFGKQPAKIKTPAQKSGSVQRTSDLPVAPQRHFSLDEADKILKVKK